MADPITWISIIGTVVSAVGAMRQGAAQESAANYNATINMQNAQIARQEASDLERQQRRETYMRMGAIHASQGHAGGEAGEGSVLDVLGDVAAQSELERQDIVYRGELKARGFTNTATLDRYSGEQAGQSGFMKAGSELLSGTVKSYQTNELMLKRT